MNKKYETCSALILFEQLPNSVSYLKACNPPTFDFESNLDILLSHCFPPSPITSNTMYTFIIHDKYYFVLVIMRPEAYYSIILVTRLNLPYLFFSFLDNLNKMYNEELKNNFDPLVFLDYAYSLISSWKWIDSKNGLVNFPYYTLNVEVTSKAFHFLEFDPFLYFQEGDEMIEIWKSLIIGSGLHIACDDPTILVKAVFSACSLINPFIFRDLILITFDPNDKRLKNIDSYLIVATTLNIDVSSLRSFGYETVPTYRNLKSNYSAPAREIFVQKTTSIMESCVFLMDRVLRTNPYNDLLEGPYITDDVGTLFPSLRLDKNDIHPESFHLIENTKTAQYYRQQIVFRDSFRQSILSADPEELIPRLSIQHLRILLPKLQSVRKKFRSDKHLSTIIRKHIKIIKNTLQEDFISRESSSEQDLTTESYETLPNDDES